MIKAHHQIDAGLCGFIDKATIVGRAKLQTIPRLHLMAGIAFDKHQLALLQPDQLAGQRVGRGRHRHIAAGRQLSPLWESFSFLCRRAAENSSFSWKKRAVFNTFHALFNTLRGKLQKETWKSKFSAGKSRGKHGGKGGKSIFVGKTC